MKINIFEGSRRIALLIAAVAIVGTAAAIVADDPYVSVTYRIDHPNGRAVRTDDPCPEAAGRHYFEVEIAGSKSVNVTLCLTTMRFDNATELVPYRIDEQGMIWGAPSYSSEVTAYAKAVESRIRISRDEQAALAREVSRRWWQNAREAVKYLAVGLTLWGICVAVVGWIVRGFLGIPRGMDRRPDS